MAVKSNMAACSRKPDAPRVFTSSRHSITVTWRESKGTDLATTPLSPLSRSPSVLTPRQSRMCLALDDRKPSKTSLIGSSEALSPVRATLKDLDEEPVYSTKECYTLQLNDRLLGWHNVYWGYKSVVKIGPLSPGDCYQFRLRVTTTEDGEVSEWSDVLTATTRDDVIAVATLHRAIDSGHVSSIKKILIQRPQAIEIPNKMGQTPLAQATWKNDVALASVLINHGADVDAKETGSWRTPLMSAAFKGQVQLVEMLREKGSSWDFQDRSGLTSLHYAVDNSQLGIVKMAIQDGADFSKKDNFGWTPLMRGVVMKSSAEVLEYLIHTESNLHATDERNQTVLMQAVLSDRPDIVEMLVRKGADVEQKNIYGHTAYDMAKSSSNKEMQKIVFLLGSEPDQEENSTAKKLNWLKRHSIMVVSPSR